MKPPVAAPAHLGPLREALRLCAVHFRYALLFSALVNLAYLAPTLYMLQVYDRVVPSGSELTLVFLTIALVITLFTLTTLDRLRSRILASASAKLDRVFSARVFRRALSATAGGPQTRVNQSIRDFDTLRAAATGPAILALFDAPWVPIYIVVCFLVHWAIGALALVGALILFVLAVINERLTRDDYKAAAEANAAVFAAQEPVGSSPEIVRALGMTEAFVARFEGARESAGRPQLHALGASGRIAGLIRFLRLLLQSLALGLGAYLAISKQISAGSIFAASMLASRALSPIDLVVAQWRTLSTARTAYDGLKSQLVVETVAPRTVLPVPKAALTLERVTVTSPARDRFLLRDVGFSIRGGAILGVLGASGAGKTTLLQVLANARTPDQGDVRIDGARYGDWAHQHLARHIGYVPQDPVLFPGTIKENISRFAGWAGADPGTVDLEAVEAAKAAGVHGLILSLPQGYDTRVGARGLGLSAGQQQRIALARALYGSPVLYVFDEPNSNLDSEGEAGLVRVLADLRARGALVVVAAHRMSLVAAADALMILKEGRVERFGARQEVLDALRAAETSAGPPPTPAPQIGR